MYVLIFLGTVLLSDYFGGYQGAGYRYGTNAREMSLGNALLCDENSGFNAFLNPALLSKTKHIEFGSSYFLMSLDRYVQAFSIARNLSSFGGASLSYFESGVKDIQGKDFNNEPTELFNSKNSYIMFSFGSKAFDNLFVGVNLKALYSSIDSQNSSGFGGDIGLIYEFSNKISSAVMIENVFSSNVWENINSSDRFPQINSLGVRWNINENIKIHSLIDNMHLDGVDIYRLKNGVEWDLRDYSLRLGFIQSSGQFSSQSFDMRVLMGFGMDIRLLKSSKIRLDYCIDFGKENEGTSNLVSFSIK